jgi:hypothetical protein
MGLTTYLVDNMWAVKQPASFAIPDMVNSCFLHPRRIPDFYRPALTPPAGHNF